MIPLTALSPHAKLLCILKPKGLQITIVKLTLRSVFLRLRSTIPPSLPRSSSWTKSIPRRCCTGPSSPSPKARRAAAPSDSPNPPRTRSLESYGRRAAVGRSWRLADGHGARRRGRPGDGYSAEWNVFVITMTVPWAVAVIRLCRELRDRWCRGCRDMPIGFRPCEDGKRRAF